MELTGVRDEFARNIGLLSEHDQETLESARIAIAGAGGVGGLHALSLARLGIGKFIVADPDTFEAVNINRQFGAFHSTIGKNKASVIGGMICDINPAADVQTLEEAVSSCNIEKFLAGVDVFIDGIDFFQIEARRLVFKKCQDKGIYALTAAPLGFGATLQVFAPHGMSFDDYFGISDGMSKLEMLAAFAAGLAPRPYHLKYLDMSKVNLDAGKGPAVSPACTLASSLIATETVKILVGKGNIRPVPCYLQIDMLRGKVKQGRVLGGGKNPLQRFLARLIYKKASGSAFGGSV